MVNVITEEQEFCLQWQDLFFHWYVLLRLNLSLGARKMQLKQAVTLFNQLGETHEYPRKLI